MEHEDKSEEDISDYESIDSEEADVDMKRYPPQESDEWYLTEKAEELTRILFAHKQKFSKSKSIVEEASLQLLKAEIVRAEAKKADVIDAYEEVQSALDALEQRVEDESNERLRLEEMIRQEIALRFQAEEMSKVAMKRLAEMVQAEMVADENASIALKCAVDVDADVDDINTTIRVIEGKGSVKKINSTSTARRPIDIVYEERNILLQIALEAKTSAETSLEEVKELVSLAGVRMDAESAARKLAEDQLALEIKARKLAEEKANLTVSKLGAAGEVLVYGGTGTVENGCQLGVKSQQRKGVGNAANVGTEAAIAEEAQQHDELQELEAKQHAELAAELEHRMKEAQEAIVAAEEAYDSTKLKLASAEVDIKQIVGRRQQAEKMLKLEINLRQDKEKELKTWQAKLVEKVTSVWQLFATCRHMIRTYILFTSLSFSLFTSLPAILHATTPTHSFSTYLSHLLTPFPFTHSLLTRYSLSTYS